MSHARLTLSDVSTLDLRHILISGKKKKIITTQI